MTISSLCFSSSNAFCSFLDTLVHLHMRIALSLSLILFFVASMKFSIVWWFLFGANFLLVGFLQVYSSVCTLTFVLSLKSVFNFIRRWKPSISSSNNLLLNFLIVETKLRFLFRSLYTSFVKYLLLKLITLPAGSDWSPTEFSVVHRTLIMMSQFVRRSWLL